MSASSDINALHKIDKNVSLILQKLEAQERSLNDHGRRITKLEEWKYKSLGVLGVLLFLLSFLRPYFDKLIN